MTSDELLRIKNLINHSFECLIIFLQNSTIIINQQNRETLIWEWICE